MENSETSRTAMTEETFDGSLDFDDDIFEEDEADTEGTEGAEAQPGAKEPEEAADDQADFLTVRFNKADKQLTRAEAIELAQKGLNYDHVKAELDSYRDGPIGRALKAYADQAGMSIEKYAEMMAAQADAAAEKKAMEELREKFPDAPDELLKEHARLQRESGKAQAKSAEEARIQREWADALAEYPEIKPDSLPQDVHGMVAQGMTPLQALQQHEIRELRAKVAEMTSAKEAKKKQEDNRARSTGSMRSMGKKDDWDDFLSEFA